MNKLLILSVALLSVSLYGADKPIFSLNGLEGWGKEAGVQILVQDHPKRDKTFGVKAVKNQVELKLRLAGIKVNDEVSESNIYINCKPIDIAGRLVGYAIDITAERKITFKYNGKEYQCYNVSRSSYNGISPPDYRKQIDKYMDQLLFRLPCQRLLRVSSSR